MKKFSDNLFGLLKVKSILLMLLFLFVSSGCNMNPPVPVSEDNTNLPPRLPRTNKPMPPVSANVGWTLLDEKRKKLSDYQGKVVILDFWATYCAPCVEGVPHLVALQNQYGKDGLSVIGLNVGGSEDRPKIADFVNQFHVQYDIAIPDSELIDLYMQGDDRIPQTFVLDRQGRIVGSWLGFNKEVGAQIEETVKKAIQE